ncbi:DUF2163 domain-containing protein [Microbacteriaceae bacterium K1510]|nr:DUF2163 domain-containing protein [Microbacteriaceae bacterium K1510]
MRVIPPALQIKLDSGVTTLCRCWLITRNDGLVQGFTDHDEDVVIGDVICRAGTGLSASEATQKLGLAVDGSEFSGALADDTLNEDDLAAGRYDAAQVELWLVDWTEPVLRVLLAKGTMGEVKREGLAFTAEVRGLSQRLSEESGRLYAASCSADLGDARCKIALEQPAYRGEGTVAVVSATSAFTASGLNAYADGWFGAGKLTFATGANAGLSVEVKAHVNDGVVSLTLWQQMPQPIAVGDSFTVTAGCDKRFTTCHDRFNNVVNFRGFPHIPGNDFVIRYPVQGEPGNDGGSLQG